MCYGSFGPQLTAERPLFSGERHLSIVIAKHADEFWSEGHVSEVVSEIVTTFASSRKLDVQRISMGRDAITFILQDPFLVLSLSHPEQSLCTRDLRDLHSADVNCF